MKPPAPVAIAITVALAGLLLACADDPPLHGAASLALADDGMSADLHDPPPPDDPRHLPTLDHRLNLVYRAALDEGDAAAMALARELSLPVVGDAVEAQINVRPGWELEQIPDGALMALGARPTVRGYTVMEALVPPARLGAVASGVPAIGSLEPTPDAHPDVGRELSQGVSKTFADRFHCRGVTGKGLHVGVVDIGFSYWDKAELDGELPKSAGNPNNSNSYHGTACAEVVADMAPEVTIHPLMHSSLAKLEYFVKTDLKKSGITVISRSLSSTGGGFGGTTGAWCDLAKKVNAAGVAWVNSAGNYGGGRYWSGTFTDADNDGWHDFAPGLEVNSFKLSSTDTITIGLTWNDYPHTAENYDLYVYRYDNGKWVNYYSRKTTQSGTQEPKEYMKKTSPAGTYGMAIYRKKGTKAGMNLRAFKYDGGGSFKYYQRHRSMNTAAECKEVIAVAAVPQAVFFTGPQSSSSSQGPTLDGRTKPDVAAPTYVRTSVKSSFSGTSAAAPHVAGAIALYMQATGKGALEAAKLMVQDAIPMGHPNPNNIYGNGRLALDGKRCGWQCGPNQQGPCQTKCGSTGQGTCGNQCVWATCVPPKEICNGKDDDCDGQKDEDGVCPKKPDIGVDRGVDSASSADQGRDGAVDPPAEDDEGSCSCRTGSSLPGGSSLLLLTLLLLVARRRG